MLLKKLPRFEESRKLWEVQSHTYCMPCICMHALNLYSISSMKLWQSKLF